MYTHQEAELKGVEEYAIECSILKVAVSEDVQNCADEGSKSMEEWDSQRIPNGKCLERCQIARIYEGTNEINRMLSVGMLIKSNEGTC
jgi:alkylation response protein AidB-like acyl-CoA dehydrogenase